MKVDLTQFCHKKRQPFDKPFTLVDRDGRLWSVGCDRVTFNAYRVRSKYPRWSGTGEELSQMLRWVHGEPDQPATIQTDELLQWIGPKPKGLGVVLGVTLDLVKLDHLLRAAPKPEIQFWKATKLVEDERCVAAGVLGRWRALLMGHDDEKVTEKDLPVFDLRGEGANVFDLAMSLNEG